MWDGDQILLERRADGATGRTSAQLDQETTSGESWGEVISLHALGLDAPIAVRKTGRTTVVPRENWQGDYEIGTTANGTPTSLCNDASGMKYMRNRYYSPETGQFTQQDPIGLAGGMNLYGFASGDPVNFSDPMGLCPNQPAMGLSSLQCAIEDIFGAIKQGPSNLWKAATDPLKGGFAAKLAFVAIAVPGGPEKAALTAAEAATARLAGQLRFTSTAAGHMAEVGRWVPRHLLAEAIQNGERMADAQSAAGSVRIVQSMFRNGKEYVLDIVYREKDKLILHFQYAPK